MNRPDKAGEPSMEEILASIRQIIADEPSSDQPEPAIEANPLVPQSPKSDTPVPLADRLSGVLKGGPLPPTNPLGSKRPLSFDQDLADMFDEQEPTNGRAVVAPKPDMRVPAGLSSPLSNGAAPVSPSTSAAPASPFAPAAPGPEAPVKTPAATDGAAPLPPQRTAGDPLVPPSPFGGAETPAEASPPKAVGFPPLRKPSFYPPQAAAPLPPQASHTVSASPASPSVGAPPAAPADASSGSAPAGVGPKADSVPDARKTDRVVPETPFSSVAPASAASAPPQSAAHVRPDFGASASQPFTAPPPNAFDALHATSVDSTPVAPVEKPAEAPRYPDPFAQTLRPGSQTGFTDQPPRYRPEPGLGSAAAHHALDALAQGLAASAAGAPAPAEPASPAVPLTRVFEPEPEPRPAPSTLPAPVSHAESMPVARTLEDAVADMLRPMLQQWVADNMPRIIERALRTEVAKSVKPGNKPPGT